VMYILLAGAEGSASDEAQPSDERGNRMELE
jgi:hypothetical protein